MEGNYPLIMHGKWTARLLVDLSNTDQNLQIKKSSFRQQDSDVMRGFVVHVCLY